MPLRGAARSFARRQPGYQALRPIIELGGLKEDENPQSLRPTDLRRAFNCVRKGGTTGTRPGVTYGDASYTAALSGTPAVQGIFQFSRDKDTTFDLITVAGGEVYIDNSSGALDKSATTITTGGDNHWNFASFQDKVFAAGGADGDGFWYWDGTGAAPGVIAEVNLGFDVKFVFSMWNMLFVAGMDGSTFDDNPMVARYCDYATDATDPLNWKQSNVIPGQLLGENFGVGSYGSEYVTGFGAYADNRTESLLMLTNRRIVAFGPNFQLTSNADAFRVTDTIATGCVAQDAFVNLGLDVGDAVYLSQDGIHSMAQSQQFGDRVTEYLSWDIRQTFDTLNRSRLNQASGAYWPTEGLVLWSVATGSSPTNDLILCMDIKGASRITPETVRWYKWELNGITANRIRPIRDTDGKPYPYVCGAAGEVVRFERDVYSDLTTNPISVDLQTGDDDLGIPGREKHIGDLYVSIQGRGGGTLQHTFVLDDGEVAGQTSLLETPEGNSKWGVAQWGTGTWGGSNNVKRHRVPGVGDSPTIAHRFRKSGANQPFWVGLLSQEVMVTGPTDDADANMVGS